MNEVCYKVLYNIIDIVEWSISKLKLTINLYQKVNDSLHEQSRPASTF